MKDIIRKDRETSLKKVESHEIWLEIQKSIDWMWILSSNNWNHCKVISR